jgi:hypothetical protein
VTTASRSSGPHRGQEPSPTAAEPLSRSIAGPSGPHSSRQDEESPSPLLRVVKGEPTAEELAALTVVVAALSQPSPRRRRPTPVGAWASRADAVRTPLQPGPGGWRAAGRFA